ncbi:MAG: hypothetical protein GQ569_13855 [Methylococcaceae bacterium]|nr:hypothetical protein [Methylococcaceae bacterium]
MLQNIQQADFDEVLKKPSSNKVQAKRFLAKYPSNYSVDSIVLPEKFELKINKKKNAIRLIDRADFDNPRIAYAVDIEVTEEKINHKSCTQVIVWASPENEELLIGFPRKVFNHLLQQYVIMITDKQQTPDGKRFWERRIIQAFNDNHFVYFCDKNKNGNVLQSILNKDDFFEIFEPLGWGNDAAHQHKLFVISLDPLIN